MRVVSPGGALRWHVRSLIPVLVESMTAPKSSLLFLRIVVNVLLSYQRKENPSRQNCTKDKNLGYFEDTREILPFQL